MRPEGGSQTVFVTGATGLIGRDLIFKLAGLGYQVSALYRSETKKTGLNHPAIRWFKGDLNDPGSLARGMAGCSAVIHGAGFVSAWARRRQTIYELTVDGTRSALDAALNAGIRKIVYISSASVFGPPGTEILDETRLQREPFDTDYDRAKIMAEELIVERVKDGQDIVIVNPTRLYGPGLMNEANSVTVMIKRYLAGRWRLIPGSGRAMGNYAYIEDVTNGIILALENGRAGERYILGGENISYDDFFRCLSDLSGTKREMIRIPYPVMLAAAGGMIVSARLFGTKPLITPGLARKFVRSWPISSGKAVRELGYRPTPFREGLRKTVAWLAQSGVRGESHE